MANKLYRAGQKLPGGRKFVGSGTIQGKPSSKQGGKTHKVKNRSVNHIRRG
jgi:hypothetical protein